MFVSYLIDPFTGVVEPVYDGFERAPMLLGDRLDVTPLWSATFDPESSVDMIAADEATLDEDSLKTSFTFLFTCDGHTKSWQFSGKTILVAVGDIPEDIALRLRSPQAVASARSIPRNAHRSPADVIHWSAHPDLRKRGEPVRRGPQSVNTGRSSNRHRK
jgi:hypothetical protein